MEKNNLFTIPAHKLSVDQLCNLLNEVQSLLEKNVTREDTIVLKGHYGIGLYYLKKKEDHRVDEYIIWMTEYNRRRS